MPNEEEVKVAAEDEVTPEEELTDTTDWEAEAKKARGIAARLRTKLVKATEAKRQPAPEAKVENKSDDYAELSYLAVKGIESDEEIALVRQAAKDTGKSIRELVTSKWFQAELKEVREANATKAAIPKGTKRSGESATSDVDYWIGSGKLPPADQPLLRQKVVQARIDAEKSRSQFTDKPVA